MRINFSFRVIQLTIVLIGYIHSNSYVGGGGGLLGRTAIVVIISYRNDTREVAELEDQLDRPVSHLYTIILDVSINVTIWVRRLQDSP